MLLTASITFKPPPAAPLSSSNSPLSPFFSSKTASLDNKGEASPPPPHHHRFPFLHHFTSPSSSSSSSTSHSPPSPHPPSSPKSDKNSQKKLVRVYLDDHTWWTLPLAHNSTAKEICGSVAVKLERSEEAFQLYEMDSKSGIVANTVTAKALKGDQLIGVLMDNWGPTDHKLIIREISKYSPLNNSFPVRQRKSLSLSEPLSPPSSSPFDKRISISVKQLQKLTGIPDEWALEPSELEIMEKISAGASSRVYKGKFKGQDVALKVMKTNTEEDHLETFAKELLIVTEVTSPHLVKFYGACVLPPIKVCLVMEYCTRGALYTVLKDKSVTLGWDMFFNFATGIVRGINALHSWTPVIVHRDLKSQNLLVTEDWQIKVCDFGLSRTSSASNQNSLSKLRGTYAYAAPEVYYGDKYSSKSDIYSMAVVLWELLTRTIRGVYVHPFADHRTTISFEFQLVIEAAKGLRPTLPPTCPPPLAELVTWMWLTDPKLRPNALQVLDKVDFLHRNFTENPEPWNQSIEPHARPSSSLSPSSLSSFRPPSPSSTPSSAQPSPVSPHPPPLLSSRSYPVSSSSSLMSEHPS